MTEPIKIPLLNTKVVNGVTVPITHADLPAAPGIANPAHVNHFAGFFKAVGHIIKDVFVWAPRIADKTITVIKEAEELTPEFLSGLKSIVEDVALITANAALAAASKGTNIATDYNVLTGIEKLAGDFNKFYPILVRDFNEFEGIIMAPAPVVPVSVESEVATHDANGNPITAEMLGGGTVNTAVNITPSKIVFGTKG